MSIFACLISTMGYKRLIIGDSNIDRFWQASQLARPQLVGVALKPVSCYDTLEAAVGSITDEFDYVLVSTVTSFLLDELSPSDVSVSAFNIMEGLVKRLTAAARKSKRTEVCFNFLF